MKNIIETTTKAELVAALQSIAPEEGYVILHTPRGKIYRFGALTTGSPPIYDRFGTLQRAALTLPKRLALRAANMSRAISEVKRSRADLWS